GGVGDVAGLRTPDRLAGARGLDRGPDRAPRRRRVLDRRVGGARGFPAAPRRRAGAGRDPAGLVRLGGGGRVRADGGRRGPVGGGAGRAGGVVVHHLRPAPVGQGRVVRRGGGGGRVLPAAGPHQDRTDPPAGVAGRRGGRDGGADRGAGDLLGAGADHAGADRGAGGGRPAAAGLRGHARHRAVLPAGVAGARRAGCERGPHVRLHARRGAIAGAGVAGYRRTARGRGGAGRDPGADAHRRPRDRAGRAAGDRGLAVPVLAAGVGVRAGVGRGHRPDQIGTGRP